MRSWMFCMVLLLASGCAVQKTEVRTPGMDEQLPAPSHDYSSGSLWQASSGPVTDDFKARRRGDVITIVISENASASKEANTDTSRSTSMKAGIPNFMGLESTGAFKNFGDLSKLLTANVDSSYKGAGSTSRKENLNATITARVVQALPNGNLLIEGRRNIKVNNEDQEILLEGTVRSKDVGPDNTVNSIYVADARISYSGRGILSDRQSPGWLMNIIDKVWPF